MTEHRPSYARTAIILIGCAAAAYALCNLQPGEHPIGIGAGAAFLMVTPWIHRLSSLAAQIFVRAVWWQAAFIGVLFTVGTDSALAPMMFAGAVIAAVGAGMTGLNAPSGSFEPAAFRRTLMASLVLAIADLIALLVYFVVWVEYSMTYDDSWVVAQAGLFIASAAAMCLAVVGLFRLRVWGLVSCIAANLVIATLACTGAFGLREFLAAGLTATAAAQLLIPLPLVREMWRARGRARLSR